MSLCEAAALINSHVQIVAGLVIHCCHRKQKVILFGFFFFHVPPCGTMAQCVDTFWTKWNQFSASSFCNVSNIYSLLEKERINSKAALKSLKNRCSPIFALRVENTSSLLKTNFHLLNPQSFTCCCSVQLHTGLYVWLCASVSCLAANLGTILQSTAIEEVTSLLRWSPPYERDSWQKHFRLSLCVTQLRSRLQNTIWRPCPFPFFSFFNLCHGMLIKKPST